MTLVICEFTCKLLAHINGPFLGTICKIVLSNKPHGRKASDWLADEL